MVLELWPCASLELLALLEDELDEDPHAASVTVANKMPSIKRARGAVRFMSSSFLAVL